MSGQTLGLALLGGKTPMEVHSVRYFSYSEPTADLKISVEIKNVTLYIYAKGTSQKVVCHMI